MDAKACSVHDRAVQIRADSKTIGFARCFRPGKSVKCHKGLIIDSFQCQDVGRDRRKGDFPRVPCTY